LSQPSVYDGAAEVYRKAWFVNEMDDFYETDPESKPAIDLWAFRHFLGSFVIGLLWPGRRRLFALGSILSEMMEEILAQNIEEWAGAHEPFWNKFFDLVFNQWGYETGTLYKQKWNYQEFKDDK